MEEHTNGWDRLLSGTATADDTTSRDHRLTEATPEQAKLSDVLSALEDAHCRTLLECLDEPLTASELIEATELSSSTVYRKLDRLSEAGLVCEYTEIRRSGPNASRYERDIERISLRFGENGIELAIDRRDADATDRMATFFQAMQDES
ncbi:helix-turn-helix domain-containing protein [Halocatena halophila]|uniref:helix-turn-helix domain-containing protein n=1 Tax=Halocatena halophila TaxID=2814576 RepID=UPI002ECFD69D